MSEPIVEQQPVEQAAPVAESYSQQEQQGFGFPQVGLMLPQIGGGFQPPPFQAKFTTGLEAQTGLLHQSIVPQSNFVFYAEAPEPPAYTATAEANTISDDVFPTTAQQSVITRDAGLVSKQAKPSSWCTCFK